MNGTDPRLDRALERVAPDVPPDRDLWPEIAARLEPRATPVAIPRRAQPWGYALAASVGAVGLTAVIAWQLGGHGAATGPALVDGGAAPATPSAAAGDERYLKARAELEATFHERLALLAPDTRARVLENLEIIRRAETDIRVALEADPASPILQQLRESTRQQEIDLYTTIGRTTAPILTRTAT